MQLFIFVSISISSNRLRNRRTAHWFFLSAHATTATVVRRRRTLAASLSTRCFNRIWAATNIVVMDDGNSSSDGGGDGNRNGRNKNGVTAAVDLGPEEETASSASSVYECGTLKTLYENNQDNGSEFYPTRQRHDSRYNKN
jgi:hypothetical protein